MGALKPGGQERNREGFQEGAWGLSRLASPCPGPGVLDSPLISLLFWILICFSVAALFTKRYSVRPLIVALILRSIYYLGIGPTLNILGALNVSASGSPPPAPATSQRHCSTHPLVPGWGPLCAASVSLDNWDAGTSQPARTQLQGCCAPCRLCTAQTPCSAGGSNALCVLAVS